MGVKNVSYKQPLKVQQVAVIDKWAITFPQGDLGAYPPEKSRSLEMQCPAFWASKRMLFFVVFKNVSGHHHCYILLFLTNIILIFIHEIYADSYKRSYRGHRLPVTSKFS